jgi:hypothetical protein
MSSKIIFVGLHNKPGKMPLCSSTKSGKLIDRIIDLLRHKGKEVLKTNLFNIDYMPASIEQIHELTFDWIERVELYKNDIVVLLGAMVHEKFPNLPMNKVVKVAHPASKRSHVEMDEYVKDTASKILTIKNLEP